MPLVLEDAELAVRSWFRSNSTITAAVGANTFFATPKSFEQATPPAWLVVRLVVETHQPGDVGFQQPLIQVDCWGKTKQLAASAALAVQTVGRSFLGRPVTVGSTMFVTGDVSSKRWLPDPVTGSSRYIVDLSLTVRGAEAA
jgi:hypothetical protein